MSEGEPVGVVERTTANGATGTNQCFVSLPDAAAHIECAVGTVGKLELTDLVAEVWTPD
jgi:hypothetical protein